MWRLFLRGAGGVEKTVGPRQEVLRVGGVGVAAFVLAPVLAPGQVAFEETGIHRGSFRRCGSRP